MSGMILCRSEYSKVPYYIEGADINVHSIEEISYFLYHDIYLVGADFFRDELFTFIEKNIKEPELAQRLVTLKNKGAQLFILRMRYPGLETLSESLIHRIRLKDSRRERTIIFRMSGTTVQSTVMRRLYMAVRMRRLAMLFTAESGITWE